MDVKNVRFDYFRVCCKEYNDETNTLSTELKLFDLVPILKKAKMRTPADNTYTVYNEDARLQLIEKAEDSSYWKMQFLRIRKNVLPGIVNNDGNYSMLDLEDDEWVGEEVSVLYDESLHIIVMQRNRNSLSVSGIEKFFNLALNNHKYIIEFASILMPEELQKLKKGDIFRKVSLSFSEISLDGELLPRKSSVLDIVSGTKKFGANSVNITLSLGRGAKKESSLNEEQALLLTQLKDMDGFTKIEVQKKKDTDSQVEIIDLINCRLNDIERMEYSRENPIVHKRVIEILLAKYEERKPGLEENFKSGVI